jgi:ubiquinone/menaquinone biosynthesis C-methylase UbiE
MKIIRPSRVSYPDYVGMFELYYSRNPLIRHYFWGRLQKLLSFIEWHETSLILEIGFGPGVLFPTLSNLSNAVIGLGQESQQHLSIVREMLRHERIDMKITLTRGDACRLPFRDELFDAVIAADVLEHIPNTADVLGEIRRVAKTGASLLTSLPIESSLRKALRRGLGYDLPLDHHTHSEIEDSIRNFFHIVKIERYPRLPQGFLLIHAQK